MQNLKQTDDK